MIPWLQIDTSRVPGADIELRLMRRGEEFSMMLGQNELMNSRLSGSEEALATLTCKKIEAVKRPHLLIGGLGMGFTLRAALVAMPADVQIEVVELVPEIIAWARGPLAPRFGGCLDDPRVTMVTADVAAQQQHVGHHLHVGDAGLVLRQAHAIDADHAPRAADHRRRRFDRRYKDAWN